MPLQWHLCREGLLRSTFFIAPLITVGHICPAGNAEISLPSNKGFVADNATLGKEEAPERLGPEPHCAKKGFGRIMTHKHLAIK